jgi:hypothetical protein
MNILNISPWLMEYVVEDKGISFVFPIKICDNLLLKTP